MQVTSLFLSNPYSNLYQCQWSVTKGGKSAQINISTLKNPYIYVYI